MTYSMTAFARHEFQGATGTFTWELRSVNHRYLEPNLRLPDTLRHLEPEIRKTLQQKLKLSHQSAMIKSSTNTHPSSGIRLPLRCSFMIAFQY